VLSSYSRRVARGTTFFAITLSIIFIPCWAVPAHAGYRHPVPAGSSRSSRGDRGGGAGEAPPVSPGGGVGGGAGAKSMRGYNPERAKRFWSHYHGGRRDAKRKPLEREK
jgi:hypothetical protein